MQLENSQVLDFAPTLGSSFGVSPLLVTSILLALAHLRLLAHCIALGQDSHDDRKRTSSRL